MSNATKWMLYGAGFAAVFCSTLFIFQAVGKVISQSYGPGVALAFGWAVLIVMFSAVGWLIGISVDRVAKRQSHKEQA